LRVLSFSGGFLAVDGRNDAGIGTGVMRGESPNQYWRDQQQLLTVGHVTTAAGSIAASYAIGVLTEKFLPPAPHFQIDLLADRFGFVRVDQDAKSSCACQEIIGFGDQGAARGVISVPSHWPEAYLLE
jgi:3-oxoacyl-(acyl-carrier-protein) synthase